MNETIENETIENEIPNQELIEGLEDVVDYLKNHPDIPKLNCIIYKNYCSKDEFLEFARTMGSYKKTYNDREISLTHKISNKLEIDVSVNRDKICKQVITWDCPDDMTSLLEGAVKA